MDKHNPNKPEPFPNAEHSSELPCSLKLCVFQNLDMGVCLGNDTSMERAELPAMDLALNFPGEGISGLSAINPAEKCPPC